MTALLAPPALRTLAPRSLVTPGGDSLEGINTTELPDGASVFVLSNRFNYRFNRTSTNAPSGDDIVAPGGGPGRWFKEDPSAGASSGPAASTITAVASLQTGSFGTLPGGTITSTNVPAGARLLLNSLVNIISPNATTVSALVRWDIGAGFAGIYSLSSVPIPLNDVGQVSVWFRTDPLASAVASLPLEIQMVAGLANVQVLEGTMQIFVLPP
jgi:hypothetical protein